METINRMVATISFKQKFLDWANQLPSLDGHQWTLDLLNEDKSAFLVPQFETNEEASEWFGPYKTLILEEAFASICSEDKWWPKDLSEEVFDEYLTAEFSSMVWDLVAEEPIEHEEL